MATAIHSKRFRKALEVRGSAGQQDLPAAVALLKGFPAARFDETVELQARLLVDPKQSSQMVRGTVSLPHGSGKSVKVIAFTESPADALAAGAAEAGLDDLIAKVLDGYTDFDVAVATTSAMKEVRKVARVLGPRGLMPNPKSGTVSDDISKAIAEVKGGRVEFKMDKTGNVAVIIGKRSFDAEKLVENAQAAIDAVGKSRPEALKGRLIKSMAISSTMSPSVDLASELYAKF